MAYDMDGLKSGGNAPGATQETNDNQLVAGVYEHPSAVDENGKPRQIITMYDPLFGNTQSEAVVRLGFVFKRDAKPSEIKSIIETAKADRTYNSDEQSDKQRLDSLELDNLRREKREREAKEAADSATKAQKAGDKEISTVVDRAEENREKDATDASGNLARANAVEQTNAREQGDTEVKVGDNQEVEQVNEEPVKEKPFKQLNRAELEELAEKEQITLPEEADTNAKIREAIEKAREEKDK